MLRGAGDNVIIEAAEIEGFSERFQDDKDYVPAAYVCNADKGMVNFQLQDVVDQTKLTSCFYQ